MTLERANKQVGWARLLPSARVRAQRVMPRVPRVTCVCIRAWRPGGGQEGGAGGRGGGDAGGADPA
jgi:hypothetical protein